MLVEDLRALYHATGLAVYTDRSESMRHVLWCSNGEMLRGAGKRFGVEQSMPSVSARQVV